MPENRAIQKSKLVHSDGSLVEIPAGEHGLSMLALGDELQLHSLPGEQPDSARFRIGAPPSAEDPVAGREHLESKDRTVVDRGAVVEFICFGRSHRYPAEAYSDVAPYWRDRLLAEAYILDDS